MHTGDQVKRICVWSGPRNISTALMYSFAQRSDTVVYDEPLYGHYLVNSPARNYHPGAEETIAIMETDGEKVIKDVVMGPQPKPIAFFKMMSHFLPTIDHSFLEYTDNVLLTRHPREMLPSYAKEVPDPSMNDIGYAQHIKLLSHLKSLGQNPPILDSTITLANPEKVLTILCDSLGIDFEQAMLSWEPGPRKEDGNWAKYWYKSVHKSRKFLPHKPKVEPFPEHLESLYEQSLPLYEELVAGAIGIKTK